MAALKHPHIVAYHYSFFDENEKHLCIILVSKISCELCHTKSGLRALGIGSQFHNVFTTWIF